MKLSRIWLPLLALAALHAPVVAQGIGGTMPAVVELEGYSQTKAKSFEEFLGRAVLVEFFAYW
ncbi:MAG: hypothetical protein L6Q99_02550 [Planctomycetes bacterium]|nr:hypothetical protein [Planctomycetota bacterium]